LTNNYYEWKVPSSQQNDNYYLSITVSTSSTPEKAASDIEAVKITQTAENQLVPSFSVLLAMAGFVFVVIGKKFAPMLNENSLRRIQFIVAKYPPLHILFGKFHDFFSFYTFNLLERRNK
jgi:hypothetical protein